MRSLFELVSSAQSFVPYFMPYWAGSEASIVRNALGTACSSCVLVLVVVDTVQ